MKKLLIAIFIGFSFSTIATARSTKAVLAENPIDTIISLFRTPEKAATNKARFCAKGYSPKKLSYSTSNLLAFDNQGGLLNAGVCWWHSRFQRNALYLTYYSPNKPRPNQKEAKRLIKDIRKGKKVVEIPGFDNFRQFSYAYATEILRELEAWQRFDGFVRQSWVVGLSGSSEVSQLEMSNRMDELYEYVNQNKIAYNKLQIKGIDAHAWLVINMYKTKNGYTLDILDSNYGFIQEYKYVRGMTSFYHYAYGNFVPYLKQTREEKRIAESVANFCAK